MRCVVQVLLGIRSNLLKSLESGELGFIPFLLPFKKALKEGRAS